jgi:hypothetical protein
MALITPLTERLSALPCWEIPSHTAPNGERTYEAPTGLASSVTTILSGSRDNTEIELWRESVGTEKADAIRDFAAARGTDHHSLIEQFLKDHKEPAFDYVQSSYWSSTRPFLDTIEHCLLNEGAIWHPEGFAGKLDNISYLSRAELLVWDKDHGAVSVIQVADDLQPTLIDWKTADTPRNPKKMYEYSLQAAAYVAGANYVYGNLGLDIQRAKIVVALPDQPPQIKTLVKDELDQLFEHFLARLQRYTFAKK